MTDQEAGGTPEFSQPIQEVINTLMEAAREAETCLKTGNKSAGRRARKGLGEVKKAITPLRQTILAAMKGEAE